MSSHRDYYPDQIAESLPKRNDRHEKMGVMSQWVEAISQCQKRLRPQEKIDLAAFTTPEALLEDLERKQGHYTQTLGPRIVEKVIPCVKKIKITVLVFVTLMRAEPIEFAALWGILHLTIRVSMVPGL